tara:strand:- start:202 stop:372 length:171 start_codon:yes stop_codon:yes gene_type:complete
VVVLVQVLVLPEQVVLVDPAVVVLVVVLVELVEQETLLQLVPHKEITEEQVLLLED